jgi:hypothetical protein
MSRDHPVALNPEGLSTACPEKGTCCRYLTGITILKKVTGPASSWLIFLALVIG